MNLEWAKLRSKRNEKKKTKQNSSNKYEGNNCAITAIFLHLSFFSIILLLNKQSTAFFFPVRLPMIFIFD